MRIGVRRTMQIFGTLLTIASGLGSNGIVHAQKAISPVGVDIVVTNQLAQQNQSPRVSRSTLEIKVVGPEVKFDEFPWQVGLLFAVNGKNWQCGGTLISEWYVLTAAHCVDALNEDDYSAIGRVRPASIVVFHGNARFGAGKKLALDNDWGTRIHKYWKSDRRKPMANDAALLKLARPFVGAIRVPLNGGNTLPEIAIVSGWGHFDSVSGVSATLRANAVSIAESATCQAHLDSEMRPYVNETTLCTVDQKRDACSGDSGGPLVIGSRLRPQLVGVVSWGPPLRCSQLGPKGTLVGGYVWSHAIADWVIEQTGDASLVTTIAADPLMPVPVEPQGSR